MFNKFLGKSKSKGKSAAAAKPALNKTQQAWLLKSISAMELPDDDRQVLLDEMEAADANKDSKLDFQEFLVFFDSILMVTTCACSQYLAAISQFKNLGPARIQIFSVPCTWL